MIRALLAKELRQHWAGFLAVSLLWLLVYLVHASSALLMDGMFGYFEPLGQFLILGAPLASAALSRLLVVTEYRERTQLFLEALPLSRIVMIATKWLLGAAILSVLVAGAFCFTALLAIRNESWSVSFIGFLLGRAGAACLAAYAFFFLMGFLGRYRFLVYALVLLFFYAASQLRQFEIGDWGPIHLLGSTFAYEREVFPWEAFRTTCILGGVCVAVTLALGLVREGSISALLAERMSHREKVVIALVILSGFFGIHLLESRKPKQPFDLDYASAARQGSAKVKVSGEDNLSSKLADDIARDVSELYDYLEQAEPLPVFVTERGDLDPFLYERGLLTQTEGFLARAPFRDPEFDSTHFQRWLTLELLSAQSQNGVRTESCRWVFDGFADFWSQRADSGVPLEERSPLILRALYALPDGITKQDLSRWLTFRETLGDDIAAAAAWSGLEVLAQRHGKETARRFVRTVLGSSVPKDVRASIHRTIHRPARVYRKLTGEPFDTFLEEWNRELARCREIHRSTLDSLPRLRGEFDFQAETGSAYTLSYQLNAHPQLPTPARYSLRYCSLPPMNEEVYPHRIKTKEHTEDNPSRHALANFFSKGSRLFYTLSVDLPELDCPVISGWMRSDIPP